jgi:hypothetical protein
MKLRIKQVVFDYFRNTTNLIVKVNEMSNYFRLERLAGINVVLENNPDVIAIDINEYELGNDFLLNESIFTLMAIYAMGTGQ